MDKISQYFDEVKQQYAAFKKKLIASTSLSEPNRMVLPPPDYDFTLNKQQKVEHDQWQDIALKGVLLNFTTDVVSPKKIAALEAKGIHYVPVLDHDGVFQRAFVTVENPQNKNEIHLYEIPYQYFDTDVTHGKHGEKNYVTDSTGFKMCAAVEHVLHKQGSDGKAEAEKIIERLSVLPADKALSNLPSQKRELKTDKDGKVIQTWAMGGWMQEVGGGFNAWEIENGRYPLQWRNLLGLEGKPKAMEAALEAMKKIGVELHPGHGKPGSTIELTAHSLGTPNAQLAKYLLETQYGQSHVHSTNFTPMAQGQILKQLTEMEYNREKHHDAAHFVHLKDLPKSEWPVVEKIALKLHDTQHLTTVFATQNYFAHYNVNGNSSLNSAPGLPGDNMVLINPDAPSAFIDKHLHYFKDGFLENGYKIYKDHMLGQLERRLTLGPDELTPAVYAPHDHHTVQDALFKQLHEAKPVIEERIIEGLHTFNEVAEWKTYGFTGNGLEQRGYDAHHGTARAGSITDAEIYNAAIAQPVHPASDSITHSPHHDVHPTHHLHGHGHKHQPQPTR